jgi:hypothetical protein
MSRKQAIYQELLRTGLASIRNVQTHSSWQKVFNKSCYYESELLHRLPFSILDPEFSDQDVWFLNNQARWYYENARGTVNYEHFAKLITELLGLVPITIRSQLKWNPTEAQAGG